MKSFILLLLATLSCFAQAVVPSRHHPTSTGASLPQAANLMAYWESADFDAVANGTQESVWLSKTGSPTPEWQAWQTGAGPTVDTSKTLNGHVTLKFVAASNQGMESAGTGILFIPSSGISGIDSVVIYQQLADPPAANGPIITWNQPNDFGNEQPYQDGNFYDGTAQNARPSIGNPTTSTAGSFVVYRVSGKSDNSSLKAWVNNENFYTASSYTFQSRGSESFYTLGFSLRISNQSSHFYSSSWVAAIYIWKVPLSTSDWTQMKAYILAKWGISL